MHEVVGLIPSAGRGSRLSLPFSKEMYPDVHSSSYRPVVMHTIDAMRRANIHHIIFTINPNKTDLLKFLGNGRQFGMQFTYCIHPEPRSLPESIDEAYHLVKDKVVAFAMPDTVITPPDFLLDLTKTHFTQKRHDVTLACFETHTPSKFGMVESFDSTVVAMIDKPVKTCLQWMWGAMVWNPMVMKEIRQFIQANHLCNEELILSDALRSLIDQGRVGMVPFVDGNYRDLGTYSELVDWGSEVKI